MGVDGPASGGLVGDAVQVGRLVERYRERLRWRHLLVVVLAVVVLLGGLSGLRAVWDPNLSPRQRLARGDARVPLTILLGILYVAGAALLSYGLARFDSRAALRRFPLTLLLSLVLLVVAAAGWLIEHFLPAGAGTGGGGGDSRSGSDRAAGRTAREARRINQSLAYGLIDQDLVERILGSPGVPTATLPFLSRDRSICLYRTADSERRLAVFVCEGARAAKRFRRIARRAGPLPGLGDRALRLVDRVGGGRTAIVVQTGPWLLDVVLTRSPNGTVDEPALIELARTAVERLQRNA